MSTKPKMIGFAIATAAATLFATAPVKFAFAQPYDFTPCFGSSWACPTPDYTDKIVCYGSNSCQGRGACKTAIASCSRQNACRGRGITYENGEHDCLTSGGTTKLYY